MFCKSCLNSTSVSTVMQQIFLAHSVGQAGAHSGCGTVYVCVCGICDTYRMCVWCIVCVYVCHDVYRMCSYIYVICVYRICDV